MVNGSSSLCMIFALDLLASSYVAEVRSIS